MFQLSSQHEAGSMWPRAYDTRITSVPPWWLSPIPLTPTSSPVPLGASAVAGEAIATVRVWPDASSIVSSGASAATQTPVPAAASAVGAPATARVRITLPLFGLISDTAD